MKIDESQKKQFIVLCALIVLVVGFFVYQMMGVGSATRTQAATSTKTTESKAKATVADDSASSETTGQTTMTVAQATPYRDPFTPQMVAQKPEDESRSANVTPPSARRTVNPLITERRVALPPMMPLLPSGPISVTKPSSSQSPVVNGSTASAESDPRQELSLTGVVTGSVPVAIIRGPANERYIVKIGQMIAGRYQVTSISSTGVSVVSGNRKYVLRLGGTI